MKKGGGGETEGKKKENYKEFVPMLRIDHSHINENARLKPGVYIRFKRYWCPTQVEIVYPG